jgi:hypothetical protein
MGASLAYYLMVDLAIQLSFNETIGKAYASKSDYTSIGPRSVIVFSPATL